MKNIVEKAERVLIGSEEVGGGDVTLSFSSNELSDAILSDITLRPEIKKPLAGIDRALMFLHEHKAITLQGGLAIMRQAMTIRLEDRDRARRYTMGDFKPLAVHYREKRFQVHVMMEYAQLALVKSLEPFLWCWIIFRLGA